MCHDSFKDQSNSDTFIPICLTCLSTSQLSSNLDDDLLIQMPIQSMIKYNSTICILLTHIEEYMHILILFLYIYFNL